MKSKQQIDKILLAFVKKIRSKDAPWNANSQKGILHFRASLFPNDMAALRTTKNVTSIISAINTIILNAFDTGKIKRTKNRKITSSEHEIQIISRLASIIQVYCCKSFSVNCLILKLLSNRYAVKHAATSGLV